MKKAVTVVLIAVVCFCLCACGAKETKVDLTMENWDSFFEIKRINQWGQDAFGETVNVDSAVWFCVKDEYADKIKTKDMSFALEVTFINADTTYTVDFNNRTLRFGGPARSEYPLEPMTQSKTYSQEDIFFNDKYYTGEEYEEETPLICLFPPDWIAKDPIAVDLDGKPYQTFQIEPTVTRIQGTITVTGEIPESQMD